MEIKLQTIKEKGMAYARGMVPVEHHKTKKDFVLTLQNAFVSGARWHHSLVAPEIDLHDQEIRLYANEVKEYRNAARRVKDAIQGKLRLLNVHDELPEIYEPLNKIIGKEVENGA